MAKFKSMDSDSDVDLFTQSDWGISIAGNMPAKLIRHIFRARGITPARLDSLATRYSRQISDNEKHRSSTKSNLLRAARKRVASWSTYTRVCAMVGIVSTKVTHEHTWWDGVVTTSTDEFHPSESFLTETTLSDELELMLMDEEYDNLMTQVGVKTKDDLDRLINILEDFKKIKFTDKQ